MKPAAFTVATAAAALRGDADLVSDVLYLGLDGCTLRLRSNVSALVERLRAYFGHVIVDPRPHDLDIVAVECAAPDLGVAFADWKREPGKIGRKDAYLDLPDARLVHKVRTGMVFLQSRTDRIAAGPCLRCDNQVINFVNAQYMTWLQNRGWLICHASGVVKGGRGLAVAGFSGLGKSTLMLRLMDDPAVSYLTNDRLFVRSCDGVAEAAGIPKLPRINPGTIVHNPALQDLLPNERREALLALPSDRLWQLEEKYDVDVERVYGTGRIVGRAPLTAFLVLNWSPDADTALRVERVDLADRRELLPAIMKSPGPFYQFPDGRFSTDTMVLEEPVYLAALDAVAIYEVSGGVDFEGLSRHCLDDLMRRGD